MPTDIPGWEWDATLFAGAARYYARGRLPYPPALAEVFAAHARLDGQPRLLDVGCGPGTVAARLAHLFAGVVGVDADCEMIAEARRLGVPNATWLCSKAEDLDPAALGRFRYATFAQSFHWMDRARVAALVFEVVEPGGAVVHVDTAVPDQPPAPPLPFPEPPAAAIDELRREYLGAERRAGQGVIRHGTPSGEPAVLAAAGFGPPHRVRVEGRFALERSVDDIVAAVFATSGTAPHLFGDRLGDFEAELRARLRGASPHGRFSQWVGDCELVFHER